MSRVTDCDYCGEIRCCRQDDFRGICCNNCWADVHMDEGDEDADFEEVEHDGQPSEYDEWQDYMGGDDYCYGSYGEY